MERQLSVFLLQLRADTKSVTDLLKTEQTSCKLTRSFLNFGAEKTKFEHLRNPFEFRENEMEKKMKVKYVELICSLRPPQAI